MPFGQLIVLCYHLLLSILVILVIFAQGNVASVHRTNITAKFTIEELVDNTFPHDTSSDVDIDPCKAGKFWF